MIYASMHLSMHGWKLEILDLIFTNLWCRDLPGHFDGYNLGMLGILITFASRINNTFI
jgi:hypothetical protein